MKNTLANSQRNGGTALVMALSQGASQPPRNMMVASAATRIMFMYSARKNSAKVMPEYSTWKPATISDSPSATSKGARLVSAVPEMKYTRNIGSNGSQFQERKLIPIDANLPCCWPTTMSVTFRLCDTSST